MIQRHAKAIAIALVSAIALLLIYAAFLHPGRAVSSDENPVVFNIEHGSGVFSVSKALAEKNLIRSQNYFKLYMKLTGQDRSLKAGSYEISPSMSTEQIGDLLTEGKVRMVQFTIPEGWNNKQIAEYLVQEGYAKSEEEFLKLTRDPEILKKYNIPGKSTEGYLFPDTYTIAHGYPLPKIHEAMLKHFFTQLKKADPPGQLSQAELHNKIILASIIEREAVVQEDRPMMARVFLNRLDKSMRLESCATIQYALGKPKKKLYEKDLKIDSPYNTYRNDGLPPGPISNPGLPALKAAFHPAKGDHLFFVLKPDGSHHFANSYKEHLRAKRKYLGG